MEAEVRRGRGREREKLLGGWRRVLEGCRANMDADVFLSSKVLKLVGTSVTCDLGCGRTQESASTSTLFFFFFFLNRARKTTVTLLSTSVKYYNLHHNCHRK